MSENKLKLKIDGHEFTGRFMRNTLRITDRLEGRSTCSFTIWDSTKDTRILRGQEVGVYFEGDRLFGGKITQIRKKVKGGKSQARTIQVKAADWNMLCDKEYVAYSWENKTLSEIVTDIVNVRTYLGTQDGITIGTIPTTPTFDKINASWARVSDIFRDLADQVEMTWNIDPDKELTFFERSTNSAPFTIGDLGIKRFRDAEYNETTKDYRNVQVLQAGKDVTANITETFRGDNVDTNPEDRRRTFSVKLPISEIVSVSITGRTNPQRIGIRGVDEDGDLTIENYAQWFYQVDSNEVSQNAAIDETNNPTLTDDETMTVVYKGLVPIILVKELDDEIEERQSVEGGSGRYVRLDTAEDVDGRDLAEAKANGLLAQYGTLPGDLTYSTDRVGLRAGMLQTISIADLDIEAVQFLIASVSIDFPTPDNPRFRIQALDGQNQTGWSEFFQKWYASGKRFTYRENEVVNIYKRKRETLGLHDTFYDSENDSVTPIDEDDDPYSVAWIGEFTVPNTGGKKLGGFTVGRSRIGAPEPSA